ncbi:hypothetical protein [Actinocorallia populi]|uniref:hypothetical protein n=1 Tax=Actinocorallia populi TaxID=2079200 RepID=UPI000D093E31|nr:hypothetical protein [Actinocorallia populi]
MGLISRLSCFAAGRPPFFVVTAAGGTAARLGVEAEARERGWRSVASPAACSVLVVCGEPGPDLEQAVERVWRQIPRPRALVRASVPGREHLITLLDRAEHELAAPDRRDSGDHAAEGHESGDEPGMADREADRDGLKLDVLHVQLGPVLADWPAGLVVRAVMQGDVVQRAEVATAEGTGRGSFWTEPWTAARTGDPVARGTAERRGAARSLDTLGRLLAVAGWDRMSAQARWLRDDLLADHPSERLTARFERLSDSVGRSRTLRWMLRDLGPVTAPPARLAGDAADRLHALLAEAGTAMGLLDDPTPLDPGNEAHDAPDTAPVSLLPDLLAGADLGAARLIVASLDPDLDRPAASATHG